MEIQKDNQGKWLYAQYDKFLSNKADSDKERIIAKQVYIPLEDSADDWQEIDLEEVQRIRQAKGIVPVAEIPEEVNMAVEFTSAVINKLDLTNEESLKFKSLYPKWEEFVGKSLSAGFKVQYDGKLYKVRQQIDTVLAHQYPSIDTAALYEEINETAAGTYEDPIPYNNNMELFNGKYYSQGGVIYKCNRDTEQAVYHDLSELVGLYVEIANE